jgi:glycosyltransferase involved in cell wall biosynthesis
MSTPYLSVVIPTYNEAQNFKNGVLDPVVPFLKSQSFSWEIIFVNDGSSDNTVELLKKHFQNYKNIRILTIPHGGKSAAVTNGVLAAEGKYILFTDFDQSTPINFSLPFLSVHEAGADVSIGVRGGSSSYKSDSIMSKLRSKIFLILVQFIAIPGILDSQCGFKSFTKQAAKKIFTSLRVCHQAKVSGGYMGAFDVEVIFLAKKFGYNIAQVPVDWVRIPSKHLNVLKEPLMMVRDTIKIRLYDILGRYAEV